MLVSCAGEYRGEVPDAGFILRRWKMEGNGELTPFYSARDEGDSTGLLWRTPEMVADSAREESRFVQLLFW